MAGYTDKKYRRATTLPIKSASIPSFNAFEFSRPMMRTACEEPVKVYSHISPYMGGPDKSKIPMELAMVHFLHCCMIWLQMIIIAVLCQIHRNMKVII